MSLELETMPRPPSAFAADPRLAAGDYTVVVPALDIAPAADPLETLLRAPILQLERLDFLAAKRACGKLTRKQNATVMARRRTARNRIFTQRARVRNAVAGTDAHADNAALHAEHAALRAEHAALRAEYAALQSYASH